MNTQKLVALTFDDGPSNITEKVLDILEQENIVGTFFLIGNLITEDVRKTVEREVSLGCEIANHSYTHSDMSNMDSETIKDEIAKTTALIKEYAGVEPKFFRPPFIALSDTMYDSIDLPFICGQDSVDWNPSTTAEERIQNVLSKVTDGALVLMHDLKDNIETLKALPVIIKSLKEEGYQFVTASQIFSEKEINPNVPHKMWSNVFDKDNGDEK